MSTVLSVIQEKVNNPLPEDPFMPDIAAVSTDTWSWLRFMLMLADSN